MYILGREGVYYAGSIDAMVLPPVDGTTSPLMNSPSGCSYCCLLGVVIFLKRDMVPLKFDYGQEAAQTVYAQKMSI